MIAYDTQDIDALEIRNLAGDWLRWGLIDEQTKDGILEKHPSRYSKTSFFARMGLFIFTYLAASFSAGMITLFLFTLGGEKIFSASFAGFISILIAAIATFVLEQMIRDKSLYKSGTDTGLIFFSASSAIAGAGLLISVANLHPAFVALAATLVFSGYAVRYGDTIATVGAYLSLFVALFYSISFSVLPFAFMLVSLFLYLVATRMMREQRLRYGRQCLQAIRLLGLLSFYLAGNYFVIQETSTELMGSSSHAMQSIPVSIFFYSFTAIVPPFYIVYALRQKDRMVLLAGLVLTAASALTFKYYFSLGHPEIALTIAGAVLILFAYVCIKYLRIPRFGLTYEAYTNRKELEALVLAQSFGKTGIVPEHGVGTNFGGGTSGGGGAGGDF